MSEPSVDAATALFAVTLPARPYPGLRPFEKHEWPIFFGRERMADAVVADIVAKKVLVIHGDSGCGKSSLVRAAVLPRLEQENARGGIQWSTCSTTPGESPLWNLARDIAKLVSGRPDEEMAIEVRRVMNFGRSAPAALAELLGGRADRQFCLLIDQFEELFDQARHCGPEEAALLTEFCSAVYRNPPEGLNVIITMRSEFLGVCARFGDFALTVNATQYLLPRMQHDDLLRAIREPARPYDGEVSRALAERLVADAGGGQDELPLIQHGLMLMYREHGSATHPWRLGLEHYSSERDLKVLLSDHADAVMADVNQSLPGEGESRLTEDIFKALTDINADGQAIRRPQTLGQLAEATGAGESAVRQVLNAFRAEGVSFLRPYGNEPIATNDRIDITHEALIRRWKAIADPKDGWLAREFRNGLVWRALLVQADSFERDPSNVLSPATTDERELWMRRRTPAWAERYDGGWNRVRTLVTASAAERDRRRAEEKLSREREEASRRRKLRQKFLIGGGAILTLLLFADFYFAVEARRRRNDALTEIAAADAARARSEALAIEARKSADDLQSAVERLRTAPAASNYQDLYTSSVQQIEAVAETLKASETKAAAIPAPGPRVYVHITDQRYSDAARAFETALEGISIDGAMIVVPGIELVKSAPTRPVLRCFQKEECQGEAQEILAAANRLLSTPRLELQDLSARYGGSANIRPRHYEIWLSQGLALRTNSDQQR